MRRFALIAAVLLVAAPANAQTYTPQSKPTLQVAAEKVRKFLKTVPNLPPDVVVVPATGEMPWPGEDAQKGILAEVWTVVPHNGPRVPLMMFAVRPDTGEVFALYLRSLQKDGTY